MTRAIYTRAFHIGIASQCPGRSIISPNQTLLDQAAPLAAAGRPILEGPSPVPDPPLSRDRGSEGPGSRDESLGRGARHGGEGAPMGPKDTTLWKSMFVGG